MSILDIPCSSCHMRTRLPLDALGHEPSCEHCGEPFPPGLDFLAPALENFFVSPTGADPPKRDDPIAHALRAKSLSASPDDRRDLDFMRRTGRWGLILGTTIAITCGVIGMVAVDRVLSAVSGRGPVLIPNVIFAVPFGLVIYGAAVVVAGLERLVATRSDSSTAWSPLERLPLVLMAALSTFAASWGIVNAFGLARFSLH